MASVGLDLAGFVGVPCRWRFRSVHLIGGGGLMLMKTKAVIPQNLHDATFSDRTLRALIDHALQFTAQRFEPRDAV